MKHIILIALALMSFTAQAQVAGAGAVSGSASESDAGAAAQSSNSLTINNPATPSHLTYDTRASGTTTVKMAPAITITGPASGPCTGLSGGFGVSWLGGSLGGNLASVDKGCQLRETSRIMAMILPTLSGDDQTELRQMLMESLRSLYSQTVLAPEPKK